jgi:hypothetical protein
MPQFPMKRRVRLEFPRETLLVEIERYCAFPDCRWRNLIGLTKSEAIEYRGFDCAKCERWNDDTADPFELPESWRDELLLSRDTLASN